MDGQHLGRPLLLLLGAALLCRVLAATLLLPDGLLDDAYISFRYVGNLAEGRGLAYNVGERVLGTTAPLFVFLLTPAAWTFGTESLPWGAVATTLCLTVVFLLFTLSALGSLGLPDLERGIWAVVVSFLPKFVLASVSGMETMLVLALMGFSLHALVKRRWFALGIAGGLMPLARPDTGIWLVCIGVASWLRARPGAERRQLIARALIPALLITSAWLVAATLYFGSPVPQSVKGKATSHGAMAGLDGDFVRGFVGAFVPTHEPLYLPWLAAAAVFSLGVWRLSGRSRVFVALACFCLSFSAVFFFSRAPLFSWYLIPVLWVYWVFVAAGLGGLVEGLPAAVKARRVRAAGTAALLLLAAAQVGGWLITVGRAREGAVGPLLEIASECRQRVGEGESVYFEHIGLFGFRCRAKILDPMGLVSPEALDARAQCPDCWAPRLIRRREPRLAILYPPEFSQFHSEDREWFLSHYAKIGTFASPVPDTTVWLRIDGGLR